MPTFFRSAKKPVCTSRMRENRRSRRRKDMVLEHEKFWNFSYFPASPPSPASTALRLRMMESFARFSMWSETVDGGCHCGVALVSLLYFQFHLYLFIFLYKHFSPFNFWCVHSSGATRDVGKENEKRKASKIYYLKRASFFFRWYFRNKKPASKEKKKGRDRGWVIDGMDIWNNDNNNNNTFFWQFARRSKRKLFAGRNCEIWIMYLASRSRRAEIYEARNNHLNFSIYIMERLTCLHDD